MICVDADPTPPRLTGYFELGKTDGTASERVGVDLGASLRDVAVPGDSAIGARRQTTLGVGPARPLCNWSGQAGGAPRPRRAGRIQLRVGEEAESRAQRAITDLVRDLKERASYVVVDTPRSRRGRRSRSSASPMRRSSSRERRRRRRPRRCTSGTRWNGSTSRTIQSWPSERPRTAMSGACVTSSREELPGRAGSCRPGPTWRRPLFSTNRADEGGA